MVDLKRTELSLHAEKAVLVQSYRAHEREFARAALKELDELARTARANVVSVLTQQRNQPDPASYLGAGKVRELARLCERVEADIVICDDDLKPAQVKNLEKRLEVKVCDRSELILDIFAQHASSLQAQLQVELAQLEYTLPRLKRMWTHLDRMAGGTIGGGIGVRGPGEKQLEVDRRLVQKRISDLKSELEKIESRHHRTAASRNEKFHTIALVGYTNAGKSTLMNRLTHAGVAVKDHLFETLDTRTRTWSLPDGREAMLSDTVGFIRKLPHHLVASFHATLEETREADLLLHVCDAAADNAVDQINAVESVLDSIGCGEKPGCLVLNKIDATDDRARLPLLRRQADPAVAISAKTGEGIDELEATVQEFMDVSQVELSVETGVGNGRLFSLLYEKGAVLGRSYNDGKVSFRVKVPPSVAGVIEAMGGKTRRIERTPTAANP